MVFFFRLGSYEPFVRHFHGQDLLDLLEIKESIPGETEIKGIKKYIINSLLLMKKLYFHLLIIANRILYLL